MGEQKGAQRVSERVEEQNVYNAHQIATIVRYVEDLKAAKEMADAAIRYAEHCPTLNSHFVEGAVGDVIQRIQEYRENVPQNVRSRLNLRSNALEKFYSEYVK